jgi:hypothetical protein
MFIPNFKDLAELRWEIFAGESRMHQNPRLYKYHWRIFWRGSPYDGSKFFETEQLSTKDALEFMDGLRSRLEPFWVYNSRKPRVGVAIWDLTTPKFSNEKWAPAYDEDTDPIHESGHR